MRLKTGTPARLDGTGTAGASVDTKHSCAPARPCSACETDRAAEPRPTSSARPSGAMRGSYVMETPDGERFEAEIPAFSLDVPGARTLN